MELPGISFGLEALCVVIVTLRLLGTLYSAAQSRSAWRAKSFLSLEAGTRTGGQSYRRLTADHTGWTLLVWSCTQSWTHLYERWPPCSGRLSNRGWTCEPHGWGDFWNSLRWERKPEGNLSLSKILESCAFIQPVSEGFYLEHSTSVSVLLTARCF